MRSDWVANQGPLTDKPGALPTAPRGTATLHVIKSLDDY